MDRLAFVAGILGLCASACTAGDPIKKPHNDKDADAGTSEILDPPTLDPVPSTTPLDTVAIRGSTDGSRIVTQAPSQTVITAVLPGGSFCQDVPLADSGATSLSIYAVGGDGRVSEPLAAEITRDPGAAQPSQATCAGTEMPKCEAAETCGNQKDDDCNGWEDDCDLTCSGCVDDEYEPNDFPFNVPTLLAGTYSMQLCPCRDDWIAFASNQNDRIHVTSTFNPSVMDLEMRLFHASPDGDGAGDQVDGSFTTTGTEDIDYTVETAGTYYVQIYALGETNREGAYTLMIE